MTQMKPDSSLRPAPTLLSAALVGTASGLRSQSGLAAVLLGTSPDRLPRQLRSNRVRTAAAAAAVGEMAVDKYPKVPDRTAPPVLAARAVLGGVAGGLTTRARASGVVYGALTGAAAAVAATYGGLALRRQLSQRLPALAAGLVEDALTIGIATLAVRLSPA